MILGAGLPRLASDVDTLEKRVVTVRFTDRGSILLVRWQWRSNAPPSPIGLPALLLCYRNRILSWAMV